MNALRWVVLLSVTAGVAFAGTRPIEAEFIAGPKVDAWQGELVDRGGDSACGGEVVVARLDRIPAEDFLVADTMQELDADGRVLHAWRVPLESNPLGIDGNRLIVALRGTDADTIAVDLEGRLHDTATPDALSDSAFAKCPNESHLPASGYRWCATLPDRSADAAPRVIAYEGACT